MIDFTARLSAIFKVGNRVNLKLNARQKAKHGDVLSANGLLFPSTADDITFCVTVIECRRNAVTSTLYP